MRRTGWLALVLLVIALATGAWWENTHRPVEESLVLLGTPIDLAAVGDTTTVCGVSRFSDGQTYLGATALRVRAVTKDSVEALVLTGARHHCKARLRAAGLPDTLPLTDIDWTSERAPARPPDVST